MSLNIFFFLTNVKKYRKIINQKNERSKKKIKNVEYFLRNFRSELLKSLLKTLKIHLESKIVREKSRIVNDYLAIKQKNLPLSRLLISKASVA